jgi:hypothetical protein
MFFIALSFLLFKRARHGIFSTPHEAGTKNVVLFYSVRLLGAVAGFLQNYAIAIGSVIIVNALQGFQFAFLLILTSALSIYYPRILRENLSGPILALKIIAIFLITGGIILISR